MKGFKWLFLITFIRTEISAAYQAIVTSRRYVLVCVQGQASDDYFLYYLGRQTRPERQVKVNSFGKLATTATCETPGHIVRRRNY